MFDLASAISRGSELPKDSYLWRLYDFLNSREFIDFLAGADSNVLDFSLIGLTFVEQKLVDAKRGMVGNFITLYCQEVDDYLTIFQRIRSCNCLIAHKLGVIVGDSDVDSQFISEFCKAIDVEGLTDFQHRVLVNLKGFIVGAHPNPYHQVYDSIAAFRYIAERNPHVRGFIVEENTFFTPKILPGNVGYISLSDLNGLDEVFFIAAPPKGSLFRKREGKKFAKDAVRKCKELMIESTVSRRYIWIGACAQKRQWQEFDRFLEKLASEFSTLPDDIYLYFDGITSKAVGGREIPSEAELELIRQIEAVMKYSGIERYVIGSGFTFEEKIPYITNTEFFVSNWLTDSMWPCLFGGAEGVGFGAKSSYEGALRMQYLDGVVMVAKDDISDVPHRKKNVNYNRISYSIDPALVYELTLPFIEKLKS